MPSKLLGGTRTNASAAPAFSPSDLANLKFWLKADSLALVDGNPVTTWPDSSGNGFDATQSTAGSKPTYKTGIVGGKPVVRFDGVDDILTQVNGAYPWGSLTTLFVVLQSTDTSFACYASQNGPGSAGIYYARDAALIATGEFGVGQVGLHIAGSTGSTFDASFRVHTFQDSGTAWQMYQNGTALTMHLQYTYGTTVTSSALIGVGARSTGVPSTDFYLLGDIAEIILYSRSLTGTERGQVTAFLGTKYSITVV